MARVSEGERRTIFAHPRIAEPDGPKFEDVIGSLVMNKLPSEPDPELVECAIAKVLEIAQRQGITAADFIQMLDSGMRISDFLNAVDILTDAGDTIDCDIAN